MKAPYSVIMNPVVSEKGTELAEKDNKVMFKVSPLANKIEIRKAIEELYPVKVVKVNILNIAGKKRRWRYKQGRTSDWKKAIVTLREGDKIEFT